MIFIPFKDWENGVGGPYTFMQNFRESLIKRSYNFVDKIEDFTKIDIFFFLISFNRNVLNICKRNDISIIQRLDGVYYPSKHGLKYLYFNKEMKADYLKYSDFIIFISEYSKLECFTMFGEIDSSRYKIIHNGTDKSIYFPIEKQFNRKKIILITVGTFRNKDMVEPIVKALDVINKEYNIELIMAGPIVSNDIKKFFNREYIKCLGGMDKKNLAKVIQQSDILIQCQLNPACPNTPMEAVSCGVPVVGFNTGAMKEILFFSPELLAHVSDDVFQKYKDFKYYQLAEKIKLCIENYEEYKRKFIKYSHLYDFEDTCKGYLEVFKSFSK